MYSQTSLFYQLFSLVTISSLLHTHWGINAFLTKTFATKILIEAKLFFVCYSNSSHPFSSLLVLTEKKLNGLMKRFWEILKRRTVFENNSEFSCQKSTVKFGIWMHFLTRKLVERLE